MPSGRIPFMMLFECLPIIGDKHPLDVRFLVKNLSAQLVVGYHPVVTQRLQGSRTDVELSAYLLVVHPPV